MRFTSFRGGHEWNRFTIDAKVLTFAGQSFAGHLCEGNGDVTGYCHTTKHFASADTAPIGAVLLVVLKSKNC
jgi:hypothetical protein